MKYSIPATMKAVMQDKADGKLFLAEVPVPKPAKGEVLIKMEASPMNPSDLSFLKGTYVNKPKYPVIPGIEGSGTVFSSGGGLLANMRLGKRVTCSSSEGHGGTWAEYVVTSAMRVVPLNKNIDFEQGAMLIVNPLTALAFIDIAKQGKHKCIVNNAAASVLGRMLVKLCNSEGIELINIVRREEQVETLKGIGAKHILNSSTANYEIELKELAHQLNATLFFDAVGGDETSKYVENSPFASKIVLYANLSSKNIEVAPRSLLQANKSIDGFYLGLWSKERSILQSLSASKRAQKLAQSDLESPIQKCFDLANAQEALDHYNANMSGGKVLLKMK